MEICSGPQIFSTSHKTLNKSFILSGLSTSSVLAAWEKQIDRPISYLCTIVTKLPDTDNLGKAYFVLASESYCPGQWEKQDKSTLAMVAVA